MDVSLQVLAEWQAVAAQTGDDPGLTMIIGAADTGKTTLARFLLASWRRRGLSAAYVDGDIGQSTLGPPTTIGMQIYPPDPDAPNRDRVTLRFVGSTSPHGHVVPLLVGLHQVVEQARRAQVAAILVDTTGLIHGAAGRDLKYAKIDLLKPRHLLVVARGDEMEGIVRLCTFRRDLILHRLPVAPQAFAKSREGRRAFRERRFREYFQDAVLQSFPLKEVGKQGTWLGKGKRLSSQDIIFASRQLRVPVLYGERGQEELNLLVSADYSSEDLFRLRTHLGVREIQIQEIEQLKGVILGLHDGGNETVALGLLQEFDCKEESLKVLTPLRDVGQIRLLHWGALRIDPSGKELGRYPPAFSSESPCQDHLRMLSWHRR